MSEFTLEIVLVAYAFVLVGLVIASPSLVLSGLTGIVVALISERHFSKPYNRSYFIMANVITDEQAIDFALVAKTAAGNAARVDGLPVWSVSDPAILDLKVAEDGLTAAVAAKGPLGACQVTAKADADLDEGEAREIFASADVLVVAAEAATLGLIAGAPRLKG